MLNKKAIWLVLIILLAGLLAACGGDTETATESDTAAESTTEDTATDAQVEEDLVAQDSGDAPGAGAVHVCAIGGADAFFAVVKNGADLAGARVEEAGSKYTWIPLPNYDNIGPDMVKLIEQAVAQECTSLAVPVWDGAAQAPALAAATAAGVKVFMYNSGLPLLEDGTVEAYGYYGTDEYQAGLAAGEYFATHGSTNVRCVNTQPGAVNWQQRCGGLVDGATANGANAEELILPAENFGDAAAISAAVQAALAADPTIDGFATGSSADADAVNEALSAMGATAQTGGWDVSVNVIERIIAGEQLFAVDQQGWYQGWLGVSQAWLYDQFSILPADPVILTGPALITADNAETVLAGVQDGYR